MSEFRHLDVIEPYQIKLRPNRSCLTSDERDSDLCSALVKVTNIDLAIAFTSWAAD